MLPSYALYRVGVDRTATPIGGRLLKALLISAIATLALPLNAHYKLHNWN
jgi:hypothetical protein